MGSFDHFLSGDILRENGDIMREKLKQFDEKHTNLSHYTFVVHLEIRKSVLWQ